MPHQCVHCSEIYDDGSEEILKGCSKCGGRFFFYLTQEKIDKIKSKEEEGTGLNELSKSEKEQIEEDVREIVGVEEVDAPIILDFESVKVLKPGKYLLDIYNLFKKERPLIYKLDDGKYIIDLAASTEKSI